MRFRQHLKIEKKIHIDLIPFIGVLFQLMIFFMLSSSFTFQPGITVKLPKTVTSDIIKEENMIISITSENVTYLNGVIINKKELEEELAKPSSKNLLILIKADRRASVGRIVDIWDTCRKNGIDRINIATNQEN